MEMHWIEIDDRIFKYLQSHAEPFIDTPNSVLNKLFFGEDENNKKEKGQPVSVTGLPKALAYVLEVVSEIEINGYSRLDATRAVAERHDTTPTTVMDKYCRQLNLKAQQADELLQGPEYNDFKNILKEKFPNYKEVVDTFFDSLITEKSRSV
jgi:hypothetical protein